MKAMVLAAGAGSRLRPLTDRVPKALIPVGGIPLLEIVLGRLVGAGVRAVIVNTHHHAGLVERYLQGRPPRGLRVEISREETLLDTGGGLQRAAWFFADGAPFILHNADVVSGVDLGRLVRMQHETRALAVLSVRERQASRSLLFDAAGALCGWEDAGSGERRWAGEPVEGAARFGFDGIQVISPSIFPRFIESGAFSLTRAYLRLAGAGERILACRGDDTYWADIGTPAKLAAVQQQIAAAGLPR